MARTIGVVLAKKAWRFGILCGQYRRDRLSIIQLSLFIIALSLSRIPAERVLRSDRANEQLPPAGTAMKRVRVGLANWVVGVARFSCLSDTRIPTRHPEAPKA